MEQISYITMEQISHSYSFFYTVIFLTLSAVGSAHLCPWYSEVEGFNGRLAQTNGSCNFHTLHITQDLGKEGHRLGKISFQSLNKVDLIDR